MSERGREGVRFGGEGGASAPAVEVRGVSFWYGGGGGDSEAGPALRDVSLRVESGERLGVLGPNGGGKSTLLKIMLGLEVPTSGDVRVFGESPRTARARGLVGYVPQRVTAELRFPLSVRQVVSMPLAVGVRAWRGLGGERRRSVERAMALAGVSGLAERPIGELSGGQLQRAMIARAVAPHPRLLLLDEPTIGIDVSGQRQFAEMLETLRAELGLTIVTVSHELRTVAATSDRVACLRRTLHYHASPAGLTPAVLGEVFSHDVDAIFAAGPAKAGAGEGATRGDGHVHTDACGHVHTEACGHAHAAPAREAGGDGAGAGGARPPRG